MSFPANYFIEAQSDKVKRDGDMTRLNAIQAAAAQISEVGFNKTTIANVAAQAGISQSGLLHHFPSKAALLAAVLDHHEQEDSDFLFGAGVTPMGWDAFDSLVALTARNASRPEWVKLFVLISAEGTVPGHPAHDWVTRHYRGMRTWLSDAVREGISRGEIAENAPVDAIATAAIGVLDGAQQQWVLDSHAVPLVQTVREHVEGLKRLWEPLS